MRLTGLEPARLTTPEPKSGVSANFTTGAYLTFSRYLSIICTPYRSLTATPILPLNSYPLQNFRLLPKYRQLLICIVDLYLKLPSSSGSTVDIHVFVGLGRLTVDGRKGLFAGEHFESEGTLYQSANPYVPYNQG